MVATCWFPALPAPFDGYAQMVVWDDRLWGGSLENVPADQLGRTDLVPVFVSVSPAPIYAPAFQQPAIVPIPEPSVSLSGVMGCAVLLVCPWSMSRQIVSPPAPPPGTAVLPPPERPRPVSAPVPHRHIHRPMEKISLGLLKAITSVRRGDSIDIAM